MKFKRADAVVCSTRCRVRAHRKPGLPAELISRARWVRWTPVRRGKTLTKVPLAVAGGAGSSTDPATWSSYGDARKSLRGVGMGFVLNGDGIGCVDLDDCVVDGTVAGWAQEFIDANRGTFIELSVSGTGVHIWGLLEASPGRVIRDGRQIEIYTQGRYIALGSPLAGSVSSLEPLIIP